MNPSDQLVGVAQGLFARGERKEAVAAMRSVAESGHSGALFQLAIWSLIGDPPPRDLPQARNFLRLSRLAGNADAALVEIALTANGTGAVADWTAARSLLDQLHAITPAAGRQCALLSAMSLTVTGAPKETIAGEPLDAAGIITRFPQLLTADECEYVAASSADLLAPALVVDAASGQQVPHPIRTSDGCVIGPTREDLVIRAVNHRIAAISATDIKQGEALTVLRYRPGQEYRLHLDTLPGVSNQRSATVLIYLNDGFEGGETFFPDLDVTITPRTGDAILYRNVRDDGRPDQQTRHAGLPVTRGEKWLATRWIRARPFDVWTGPEAV